MALTSVLVAGALELRAASSKIRRWVRTPIRSGPQLGTRRGGWRVGARPGHLPEPPRCRWLVRRRRGGVQSHKVAAVVAVQNTYKSQPQPDSQLI